MRTKKQGPSRENSKGQGLEVGRYTPVRRRAAGGYRVQEQMESLSLSLTP
jgi:hypothetical protein